MRAVLSHAAVARERYLPAPAQESVAAFWTDNNVTRHHRFSSAEESLEYFNWRCSIYHGYLERMPVAGADGLVVLDYGCGPGHDLVGFGHYSRPERLIGIDVSPTSLSEARERLRLHGVGAEIVQLEEGARRLPLEDASVDYLHSSGVLHHVPDPVGVLRELRRVLKPGGTGRIMVYNWDSIFLHLYVPYVLQLEQGLYAGWDVRAAFQRATDGARVPISEVYRPAEWVQLVESAGLECEFLGAAVSMLEMSLVSRRFDAIGDQRLAREHRDFLAALRFDEGGWAVTPAGHFAGVDGCFAIRRPPG